MRVERCVEPVPVLLLGALAPEHPLPDPACPIRRRTPFAGSKETIKNPSADRVSRFLPIVILAGLALTASLSAGVNTWTTSGPEGGDIRALAIDPKNPATLYAGTSRGGVFKSIDGGASWRAVNTGLTGVSQRVSESSTEVTALVIDPSTPTTLYAGRSGVFPNINAGVFKSTDGGGSWSPINATLYDTQIQALAIDPSAPAILYAGGSDGVFKSTDGGGRWSSIGLSGDGGWDFGEPGHNVTALAIGSSALYAGTWDGVFKMSSESGWAAINSGLTSTSVNALAIDRGGYRDDGGEVYYVGTAGGVFTSTDGGASWTAANVGLANTVVNVLVIDPSGRVYAGTEGGVFKSADGGHTWTAINAGLTSTSVLALAIHPLTPATLYAGTQGGGVFKSTDGGGSWAAINAGLTGTFVQALAGDPSGPATLYAGTDGSGAFKSGDGGGSWTAINAGLTDAHVSALVFDPSTPSALYAGTRGGVFKSGDGGESWAAVNAGLTETGALALAMDPSTPRTLYAGGDSGAFKSTNGGESWTTINAGLIFLSVFALAVDTSSPGTLYAGGYGRAVGGLFKSTNGGESWTAASTGLADKIVYALAIDPSASATIYAGTSGGVFRSVDGGGNWTATSTGLTDSVVSALAIDPSDSRTLYAGTNEGGVFKSTNAGSTWTAINAGLGNPTINALIIDRSKPTRLYAGTGSGVYEVDDYLANCVFDSTTLCLSGGRFKVTTQWATAAGQNGSGQAVVLPGGDTGYFTFFDPGNVEVVVKVLNGCGSNGNFWIFAGGLTDVSVVMTVTDGLTGVVKTYANPPGTPFRSIQDTETFATCAAGSTAGARPYDGSAESSLLPPGDSEPFGAGAAAPCVANVTTLCLSNSRYQVRAQWVTPDGASGAGRVINLTGDTGGFWFFSPSNLEVVVKVLNGCGSNARYWTFAGGLTDVNVTLTVTDTQTGTVQTYMNPQGTAFEPIQDTNAFAACP